MDADFRKEYSGPKPADDFKPQSFVQRKRQRLLAFLQHKLESNNQSLSASTLSALAGLEGSKGFSNVLSEANIGGFSSSLADRLRVVSGGTTRSPELLLSSQLAQTFDSLYRENEITIVCAAPALTFPDSAFVAHCMDFAIIAVRAEKCTAADIEKASTSLVQSGVTLLGAVVTGIAPVYAEGVTG